MIANGAILVPREWTGECKTWTVDWTMDCFHTRR